ncbi:NAD(P)H-hydrate dehydratase [Pseudomonas oryzae]|uniref:Bifunctional NAD(P)H-hydrate repair enzyme n=1 Tax=Pseudomonas oryzae TaxID=1392877 RepID=A0A1H1Z9S5_9PSED|nr:NAD(P)H-hydrate dehydratase [Pseudomonas oryzae]SDT29936.1 NAD(P)H-hydrate epimerase [Pseudomonas oryzae]
MPQTSPALPLALYRAAQVRELDARLIAAGTPGSELMQRAAHALWRAMRRRWPDAGAVTVLAGRGNNAGDGYLVAALAQRAGWRARVLAVTDPAQLGGDAASAHAVALAAGVPVEPWRECAPLSGVLVDALLGTGLSGEVREPYAQAIRLANASGLPVLAVDLPSGLCGDTGRVLGVAIRAELTVTLLALKLGLFCLDGPDRCGELAFDDLGADPERAVPLVPAALRLAGANVPRLAPRLRNAHKGQFGHVLLIGGESGYGGAALLAAESCLRAGAGLVSLATRGEHVPALLARRPEVMARGVRSANEIQELAAAADVLVLGPGIGQGAWARSLLGGLGQLAKPQVWDADALNLLAAGQLTPPADDWLITPHPGEAARLLGCSTAEVQADRPAAALTLARRLNAVVLLKGLGSLVATPQGELYLCDRGHPAMAGAGLGDVLAGLLGALLAQGLDVTAAARLGVWLHAAAGERLGGAGRGLAAADLIEAIRELLEEHSPCLK